MKGFRWLQFFRLLAAALFVCASSSVGIYGAEGASERAGNDIEEGKGVTFLVDIGGGSSPFTFQWHKDGVPITGATEPVLAFGAVRPSDAGAYTISVTNEAGSTTSPPEILVVRPLASRLSNVSIITSGEGIRVVGFALSGGGASASTRIIARAAGPALRQFGLVGVLDDPVLNVFQETRLIGSNDDWNAEEMRSATVSVGAFPFPNASRDSAMMLSLPRATYSAQVRGAAGETGIAIVELYELSADSTADNPRLVNISARSMVGTDGKALVAGFTVRGVSSLRVLLRGIGPTLAKRFGIPGAIEDPKLTLLRDSTAVATNQDWRAGGADEIASVAGAVGAFALSPDTVDSAMMATLSPGSYTVELSSVSCAVGTGLIELYEVSEAGK